MNERFWKWVKLNYKAQEGYRFVSTKTLAAISVATLLIIFLFKPTGNLDFKWYHYLSTGIVILCSIELAKREGYKQGYFDGSSDAKNTDFSLDPDEIERDKGV